MQDMEELIADNARLLETTHKSVSECLMITDFIR